LPPSCQPLYATNSFHRKQETITYEYPLHFAHKKAQKNADIR
jgi:hypothetical protein